MSTKTEALIVHEKGGSFVLQDVQVQEPQPYEVLIEIKATGICHTDVSCANGIIPVNYPAIFGHEGAGTVSKVGSDISDLQPGDNVLLSYSFCSNCKQCKAGYLQYCEKLLEMNFGGKRLDGNSAFALEDGSLLHAHFFGQSSFSHLAVANRASVVKVPEGTDLKLFAPLGCGVQTGAGTTLNTLDVQPGSTFAVFGCGSVGLSALMASKIRGAKEIIAIDLNQGRLDLAKELGATATILSSSVKDVPAEIQKICGSAGVQYAVDCTGVPQVIETMIDSLDLRGRACSVGAPSPGKRASVDVFKHLVMGRQYVGCHQGDSNAQKMALYLIEQHKQGAFPLDKIVTYYNAKDFEKAFADMKAGTTIKPVLVWN